MIKENSFRIQKILFAIISVTIMIFAAIRSVPLVFTCVLFVFVLSLYYCLLDLKNRSGYLVFLLSFFLFLLGGEVAENFFGFPLEGKFSKSITEHAYVSLLLSLIFCFLGFFFADRVDFKSKNRCYNEENNEKRIYLLRKISFLGIVITSVPMLLRGIEAGMYVAKNGYLSYYTTYKSSLPTALMSLAEMFTMFIFLYLAIMPTKKKCILPMTLYLIYGAIGIFTGRRVLLGTVIMVMLFYIIVRNKMNPEEKWITKKTVIIFAVLAVILVIFFYNYKYIRYGDKGKETNPFRMLLGFLSQQGVSVNVIKYQKLFEGDSLGITSLYWTFKYLRTSYLTGDLFLISDQIYDYRSLDTVLFTNNLADYIQYNISVSDYFSGYGYGTSFIAEAYHDFGYLGVGAISMLYGFLLSKLYSFKKSVNNVWRIAIALLMLEQFVILPRYSADVILKPFYNLTNVVLFTVIVIFVELYSRSNYYALCKEY